MRLWHGITHPFIIIFCLHVYFRQTFFIILISFLLFVSFDVHTNHTCAYLLYLPTSETPNQGHDPHSQMKMRVITRNDIFGHTDYCKSYDIISSLTCIINDHMYVQINSCINKLCRRLEALIIITILCSAMTLQN